MKRALWTVIFLQILFTVGHFVALDYFSNHFSVIPHTIISYDNYLVAFFTFILVLSTALLLGWITWLMLRKRGLGIVKSLLVFNSLALVFWSIMSLPALIRNYNEKMRLNAEQSQRMIFKNGGYLDTCMIMVHNDIASSHQVATNNFILLWFKYDEKLSEIPKDTVDGKFPLKVIYGIKKDGVKSIRESQYLFDLNYRFFKVKDTKLDDNVADAGLGNFEEFTEGERTLQIERGEVLF